MSNPAPTPDPAQEVVDALLTTPILDVPGTNTPTGSRSQSPVGNQTNTTEYRISTQMSRLCMLEQINEQCSQINPNAVTIHELDAQLEMLNNMWTQFNVEHEHLGISCKKTLFTHPYMTEKVLEQAFHEFIKARSLLLKYKSEIVKRRIKDSLARVNLSESDIPCSTRSSLPDIKLPEFSGDFDSWPSFRDLFKSMVIQNNSISKVEKLHYLKTSITGPAAKLISNLPVCSDSFDTAWERITARFDDKERLILSYVEKLFSNTQQVPRTAHDMDNLVSSTREILSALKCLDVPTEQWNYVLLYVIARQLDSASREAWEVKRSSSAQPTNFEQLLKFIEARARALEAVQPSTSQAAPRSSTSTRATQQPHSAHFAATQPTRYAPAHQSQSAATKYPCDHCRGDHYIVMYPKFRDLNPTDRHKVVTAQRQIQQIFLF